MHSPAVAKRQQIHKLKIIALYLVPPLERVSLSVLEAMIDGDELPQADPPHCLGLLLRLRPREQPIALRQQPHGRSLDPMR